MIGSVTKRTRGQSLGIAILWAKLRLLLEAQDQGSGNKFCSWFLHKFSETSFNFSASAFLSVWGKAVYLPPVSQPSVPQCEVPPKPWPSRSKQHWASPAPRHGAARRPAAGRHQQKPHRESRIAEYPELGVFKYFPAISFPNRKKIGIWVTDIWSFNGRSQIRQPS